MFCSNCGKEIDDNSKFCQFCGTHYTNKENSEKNENNSYSKLIVAILGGVIFLMLIMFILNDNFSQNDSHTNLEKKQTSSLLTQIYDSNINMIQDATENYWKSILKDEIEKYNMAAKQNDKMNACISAGQVSQIYLELKDNENYNKWKSLEKRACSWMNY